ncbi:MAG: BamA/TamA family outer membrane protein [Candidatus Latescibacterota bacterium]
MALLSPAVLSGASQAGDPFAPRIGDIRLHGNNKIRSYILLREIPFTRGDLFDEAKLDRAHQRIRAIPGVDYSNFRVAYSPRDSSLILTLIVTEKPTFNGRPLIRRGYQNKMSFGLELWEKNFRGHSEKLSASVLLRGNTLINVSWRNPWVGAGPRVGLGVNLFYKDYIYVYDDVGPLFTGAPIERYGGEVVLFRDLGSWMNISLAGGFESAKISPHGELPEPDRTTFATASLTFRYDSRRTPIYPWNGMYFEASAKELGPGSENVSCHEGLLDVRLFKSVAGRAVLAGHSCLLYRNGDKIPIYRRDHLGGAVTLRGYDYGSFHGNRSLLSGVEGRLPVNFSMNLPVEDILLGMAFHVFADAAAAWDDDDDLSSDNVHGTFGAGVVFISEGLSGIRFDYGWRLDDPGRFEFDVVMKF